MADPGRIVGHAEVENLIPILCANCVPDFGG
jgi:hypothetical protein